MELYWTVVTVLLGLIIGSFLSVCIYRIPLGRRSSLEELDEPQDEAELEESGAEDASEEASEEEVSCRPLKNSEHFEQQVTILFPPRSFCPACGEQLPWYYNIPLLSWLALGGRCGKCKTPISIRYPLVELLSAFFAFLCVHSFGASPTAAVIYLFCCALLVISYIDYDYYIIPNVISYPGTALGFALALLNDFTGIFTYPVVSGIKASLLGVLAGAGVLYAISEGYFRLRGKEGLGLGDVKLLAMTGALLGLEASLYTIFVGSMLGSVVGLLLILIGGRKMSQYLPFGPYLAVATLLYVFVGTERTMVALGLNPVFLTQF